MKKTLTAIGALLLGLLACRDEFHPLTPPKDPLWPPRSTTTCQAPSIEKNIIGTWHFASTFNSEVKMREGTVTFEADKKITDPDSLFADEFDVGTHMGRVISKTYDPLVFRDLYDYSGYIFDVYLNAKEGTQTNFFVVLTNECDKVVMTLLGSYNNSVKITLTR